MTRVLEHHRTDREPCPRCLALAWRGRMPLECVQPLPPRGEAPLAVEDGRACCYDCAATDTALKILTRNEAKRAAFLTRDRYRAGGIHAAGLDWDMMRIAVANDRSTQYRMPGAPMGLVLEGWVQPSVQGEFEEHLRWMTRVGLQP